MIRRGLEYVGGNYAELVRYFKLPDLSSSRRNDPFSGERCVAQDLTRVVIKSDAS